MKVLKLTVLCLLLLLTEQGLISAEINQQTHIPTVTHVIPLTATGFTPSQAAIVTDTTLTWRNDTETTYTLRYTEQANFEVFIPIVIRDANSARRAENVGSTSSVPTFAETKDVELAPGESFSYVYKSAGDYPFQIVEQAEFGGTVFVRNEPSTVQLLPIGNQTAPLGQSLQLRVLAVAPNDQAVSYEIAPLPLPDNMMFDATSGALYFRPNSSNIGQLEFTIIANDGSNTDSETIQINIPTPDPSAPTALRGRLLDANDAEKGLLTPLVGATITHIENSQEATTDADGYFTLSGISAGAGHVDYNGFTATPTGTFGAYRSEQQIIANVTNMIERPVYIMALDTDGQATVDPETETTVHNPNVNTTVVIPPHTVVDESGNEYAGVISISEVPDEFTPGSLPDHLDPSRVLTIQPMGLTFNTPAPITFPNIDGLSSGSEVDIWSMNHETSEFFIAGKGRVSADGSMIETIEGGIREASWHFPGPPPPAPKPPPDGPPDGPPPPPPDCPKFSSSLQPHSGCLKTSVTLPTYSSIGRERGVTFVYQTKRAFPMEIVPFETTILERSAVPDLFSYQPSLAGVVSGEELFLDTSDLNDAQDETIRASVALDATTLDTGAYPYMIQMTNHFGETRISGRNVNEDRLIVVNSANSELGAGWGISGLQRLYPQPDGSILFVDGSGNRILYRDPFAGHLINFGEQVAGTISEPLEVDTYTFEAQAEQSIFIDALTTSANTSRIGIRLEDPNGDELYNRGSFIDSGVIKLGDAGNYTLSIYGESDETGSYLFQLWDVPEPDQFNITIGDSISDGVPGTGAGNLETPRVQDKYTFTATAGQSIFIDTQGTTSSSTNVFISLHDSDGAEVDSTYFLDSGPHTLAGGTYTLTVSGRTDTVATYSFKIWDVPTPDPFNIAIGDLISDGVPGTGAGNLETPGVQDKYTFTAATGQSIFIDTQGTTGGSTDLFIALHDSDGVEVDSTYFLDSGPHPLAGGTYTLTVDGRTDTVATYSFKIWDVPTPNQFNIAIGDLVSDGVPGTGAGNLETPGVQDKYTFTATAGQSIFIDTQGTTGGFTDLFISLHDSDGAEVDSTYFSDSGPHPLAGGTYTLTVDGRTDEVATYSLKIWDVPTPDQFNIAIGDLISDGVPGTGAGNLETPGVQDKYTFTATAGQSIFIDTQGTTGGSTDLFISLHDSDGVELDSTYFFDSGPHPLAGGTYILTVDGRTDEVATYSLQLVDGTRAANTVSIVSQIEQHNVVEPPDIQVVRPKHTRSFANKLLVNQPAPLEVLTYTSPDGDFATLILNEDGSYTRRMKGGTISRFNAEGYLLERVDRNGNSTRYGYDSQNRLVSITDPADLIITLTYSGEYLASVTDPMGRQTTFTHDANGNLTRVTLPDGATRNYGYDERHLMTSETDERGNTRTRTYNFAGQAVETTLPNGTVRSTVNSQLVGLLDLSSGMGTKDNPAPVTRPDAVTASLTDGENRTVTYQIGELGRFGAITDPNGLTTQIDRNAAGKPTEITLSNGAVYRKQYDERGNVVSYTDEAAGGTSTFTYESTFNRMTSSTNPFGRTTTYEYDSSGNLTKITTPLNRTETYTYNSQGQTSQTANTLGTLTDYTYNANGHLTSISQGAGNNQRTTTMTYTGTGYPDTLTDPLGHVVDLDYDAMGQLTQEQLPGNRIITYAYDAAGNLASVTPPGRPAHSFDYNELDMMTAVHAPPVTGGGSNQTTYHYNHAQQLTQIVQPDGSTLDYAYDSGGRINAMTIPAGSYSFAYDATTGQAVTINAPGGEQLSYGYNGDLLTEVTWGGTISGTVSYQYDAAARPAHLNIAGTEIAYAYDHDSMLTQVGALNLTYDSTNGHISGTSLANVTDSWDFNPFSELTQYSAAFNGSDLFNMRYSRDKLGRVTEKVETIGGATVTTRFTYDAAGRLWQVHVDNVLQATYTYDANGNRLSDGKRDGTYDDQDRLLTYGNASYSYTANGDLLSKTEAGQTTTYAYDALGNLRTVTLPNGTDIEYVIDGADRRIGKRVNDTLVQGLLYSGELNPVVELDGTGNVVSRFVYGSHSNVPDYMVKAGVTYRIIADHLGSVRLVVNADTGDIVQRIDYDAWGVVTADSNPGFQPFGYAGGIYDADTGLVRFGARDYDAEIGRWTAKDPLGFAGLDTNLYAYVANDPINKIDPSGEIVPLLFGLAAAAYGAYSFADAVSRTFTSPLGVINAALDPSTPHPTTTDLARARQGTLDGLKDVIKSPTNIPFTNTGSLDWAEKISDRNKQKAEPPKRDKQPSPEKEKPEKPDKPDKPNEPEEPDEPDEPGEPPCT